MSVICQFDVCAQSSTEDMVALILPDIEVE